MKQHQFFNQLILVLGLIIFGLWLQPIQSVQAASTGAGFTVTPDFPSNQASDTTGYLDLFMQPGAKQTLTFTVKNTENSSKTITASPNTGYTTASGSEAFDKHLPGKLSQAEYQFSEIFSAPQTIKLAPNQTKKVQFALTMPEKMYQGVLEGGLYFLSHEKGATTQTNQSGFSLTNRFAIGINVILREHRQQTVKPQLTLTNTKVQKNTSLLEPAITAKLTNATNSTLAPLSIDAKVTRKGSKKIVYRQISHNLSMATQSFFTYKLPLGADPILPGTYTLQIKAHDTSGNQFNLKQTFKVSVQQSLTINQKNKKFNWFWIIVLIVIVVLLLLVFVYYLGRRKRQ